MEEGIVIGRVALNTAFQHLHSFPDSMEDTMTIMQNIRDSIAAWGTSKPRSVFVSEDSKHHQGSESAQYCCFCADNVRRFWSSLLAEITEERSF